MSRFTYTGAKTRAISFPLGGIGTGSIGLSGTGRLVDWEIFNRPNRDGQNGFSFFAVRGESNGKVEFARILNGDAHPPFEGDGHQRFRGIGFGVNRETASGFPHFRNAQFRGKFPIAEVDLRDGDCPVEAVLTAFNPFIPLNEDDSSLPLACFEYRVRNTSDHAMDITVAAILSNPNVHTTAVNRAQQTPYGHAIRLCGAGTLPEAPEFGEVSISTDAAEATYQEYWYRGEWFDNVTVFWREFSTPGPLPARTYDEERGGTVTTYNFQDVCTLAVTHRVAAGAEDTFRFAVTWYYPNFVNYWHPVHGGATLPQWKNYYATQFSDSLDVARYWWSNRERLTNDTKRFQDTLLSSTLPDYVLDAVSANMSVLKSPTCVRLTDGTLYGFEGCHAKEGCCEGSCSHVWNYEQTLPFLFPRLARSMREIEYRSAQFPDGKMAFRLLLPTERTIVELPQGTVGKGRPAADGQMGQIIRTYREWRVCGDDTWLASLWPNVKKALEYAWSASNEEGWDRDHDGVMEGTQHHTLDVEIYGPNSYITLQYHAALLAAAEMAEAVGDRESAEQYRQTYRRGRQWVESNLFNGEYFFQHVDLTDARYPRDPELGEMKYQIGTGCHIDQVLGQWYAHVVGLGYIMDVEKVRSAASAVFRHNFRSMRGHANANRIYALNDEEGMVICTWPRGGAPKVPVPYADECMNGFEYQIAAHLIIENLIDEGLRVVRSIRDRYDGERRNPWNEFECGSHYARSMASYGVLLALSGFEYDARKAHIGFSPKVNAGNFSCFWSLDSGWGELIHDAPPKRGAVGTAVVSVVYGTLQVRTLTCGALSGRRVTDVKLAGKAVAYRHDDRTITLDAPQALAAGTKLEVLYA